MHVDKLTHRSATAAMRVKGIYPDGRGLHLNVSAPQRASWLFYFISPVTRRRREMGFGPFPEISIAEARTLRDEARRLVRSGVDPIEARRQRRRAVAVPNLGAMAEACVASRRASWKSEKHAAEWLTSLRTHCGALLSLPVDRVTQADILGSLKPIWETIPVTASRVRNRLEIVLDFATAHGHRTGDNPAAWKSLQHLLGAQGHTKTHHRALAVADIPALMARLSPIDTSVARCLAFTILTCARSGEARGARWEEIDGAMWVVPAARMKAGREHRVPLSKAALALIGARRETGLIFPGRAGGTLDTTALPRLLLRLGYDTTVHGMRSVFSTWAHDRGTRPDLVEQSLGHLVGGSIERAYSRGDRLRDRSALMELWGELCRGANVITLPAMAS